MLFGASHIISVRNADIGLFEKLPNEKTVKITLISGVRALGSKCFTYMHTAAGQMSDFVYF